MPYAALLVALTVLLTLLVPAAPVWAATAGADTDCEAVSLGTHRGTFSDTDPEDCLELPLPSGARLAALAGGEVRPAITVIDASGASRCDASTLSEETCELTGQAPFRAVVRAASAGAGGSYAVAFHRTDAENDCPVLPAGDFSSSGASVTLATNTEEFAHCLSIPAGAHSAAELLQLRRVSGSAGPKLSVVDTSGRRVCGLYAGLTTTWTTCLLTPGTAHTLLYRAGTSDSAFTLARRDVTATAKGCTTTAPTLVGGPSKGGTPGVPGVFKCRQVTASDTADVLHLNVRDPLGTLDYLVHDATGKVVCTYRDTACAVTGSSRYQVLMAVREGRRPAASYRFDALLLATAAGPAPECPRVNVAYGYGPLSGTLDEQHTAVCRSVALSTRDSFEVLTRKDAAGAPTAVPALYGKGLADSCHRSSDRFLCATGDSGPELAVEGFFVLGLPEAVSSSAFGADVRCTTIPCGHDEISVGSVGPGSGVTATKAVVYVKGSALHPDDSVHITSAGKTITSTTVAVSDDRKTLKAVLDLRGAATGVWSLTVRTRQFDFGMGSYTVTSSPLKNTTAPAITGTARVGAKLAASRGSWTPVPDSYTYQWKADGVAIEGATGASLVVPAAALGKKVTVTVRAHSAKYGSRSATSAATAAVGKGVAPKATTAPSVGGTAKVGRALTAARGTWSPVPTSYRYQWYADGTAIDGATGTTLVLRSAQRGKRITVKVTALRTGHYSGTAVSAPTAAVVA
ncbi:hypothetical protein [Streptomyces sp. NPDC086023]|uniref:hypothetical protein n=1 Tax=Streptomyces sp. NPDC086023 TaxID=3365746 RepID=UPI0037CE7D7D